VGPSDKKAAKLEFGGADIDSEKGGAITSGFAWVSCRKGLVSRITAAVVAATAELTANGLMEKIMPFRAGVDGVGSAPIGSAILRGGKRRVLRTPGTL
jgi:hypothetical protein